MLFRQHQKYDLYLERLALRLYRLEPFQYDLHLTYLPALHAHPELQEVSKLEEIPQGRLELSYRERVG